MQKSGAQQIQESLEKNYLGRGLFDCKDFIIQNEWNTRVPQDTAINALYRATGFGAAIHNLSGKSVLIIVCSRTSIVDSTLVQTQDGPYKYIQWHQEAQENPPSLADGHHRLLMQRQKKLAPLEKQLDELRTYLESTTHEPSIRALKATQNRVEKEFRASRFWVADVYDKGVSSDQNISDDELNTYLRRYHE